MDADLSKWQKQEFEFRQLLAKALAERNPTQEQATEYLRKKKGEMGKEKEGMGEEMRQYAADFKEEQQRELQAKMASMEAANSGAADQRMKEMELKLQAERGKFQQEMQDLQNAREEKVLEMKRQQGDIDRKAAAYA